ncbi:YopX family protein [Paenibacillus chitinolyticus]
MSRPIKFRGKRIDNGEWVYGYYVKGATRHCIMSSMAEFHRFEVDPETVGQYTGLTDRNGKEIYEGDVVIVKIQAGYHEHFIDKKHIREVKYLADKACWYPFNVCHMWREDDGTLKAIEVIGNAFEHPHLLEQKEEGK